MTKTDIARIWREVYGGTRFDSSMEEFVDKILVAVNQEQANYVAEISRLRGCIGHAYIQTKYPG